MPRDTREFFDFSKLDEHQIILCDTLPPINEDTEDVVIAVKKKNGSAYTVENGSWVVQSNLSDFLDTYLRSQND